MGGLSLGLPRAPDEEVQGGVHVTTHPTHAPCASFDTHKDY